MSLHSTSSCCLRSSLMSASLLHQFAVSGRHTPCNAGIAQPCPKVEPLFVALQIYER